MAQALKFYKYANKSDISSTVDKGAVYFCENEQTIYVANGTTLDSLKPFGNAVKEAELNGTNLKITNKDCSSVTVNLSGLTTSAIAALDATVSNATVSSGTTASTQIKTTVTETDGKLTSVSVTAPKFATAADLEPLLGISNYKTIKINNGDVTPAEITASTLNDTLTLSAGTNVTLTPVEENSSITISSSTSKNVIGGVNSTANDSRVNGNVYLNHLEGNTVTSTHKIEGTGAVSVSSDSNGNIQINGIDTKYVLSYDSENKKIKLGPKLGPATSSAVVSEIDATAFIKDGMLSSADFIAAATAADKNADNTVVVGDPYIKLTWNNDAGKTPMYVPVKGLVDTYTAGDGIALNGSVFSINSGTAADNITVSNPKTGEAEEPTTTTLTAAINSLITKVKAADAKAGVTSVGVVDSNGADKLSLNGDVRFITPLTLDTRDKGWLPVIGVNSKDHTTDSPDALVVKLPSYAAVKSISNLAGDVELDTSTTTFGEVKFGTDIVTNTISGKVQGLGTAAGYDAASFATAAQGSKADSAIQSITGGDVITVTKNGTAVTLALEWAAFN